ncbi:TetR/AcrR family transcriptional regulator [Janthinobacterium fluminis]|uniref:TetR family transcriptional regulator n=1 Tax=Janthinobacterium fluminis TaxID=2987524 RepID=A0ABT5K1V2_9BURK|nr:TetR/AcrR family transcriptional regulator [Janthinobacterium fluminis]MDC8758956.1 TetR family transcriptional regulator [Janthinobacterium fluminis]
MKIPKSKPKAEAAAGQDDPRRLVLRAAVDLMSAQGYAGTSMKQIARAAGVGDAGIYRLFASKEKLLTGYYELAIGDAIAHSEATPGFDEYSLQERLQRLVDAVLDLLLADREFVALSATLLRRRPLLMLRERLPGAQLLEDKVLAFLAEAEDKGDIARCQFKPAVGRMFADYLYTLISYWLDDDSAEFSKTTELVDLTLSVLVLSLRSGVGDKCAELGSFLVRDQMSRWMGGQSGMLDMLQRTRDTLSARCCA